MKPRTSTVDKPKRRPKPLTRQQTHAAGEAWVQFNLLRRGFYCVNANTGVRNTPNIDLIMTKGEKAACFIQVKASRGLSHVMAAGVYRADGRYFNTKEGPKADFVVFVQFHKGGLDKDDVFIVPIKKANRIVRRVGEKWVKAPMKSGGQRKKTFPIWLHVSQLARYRQAWDLLEAKFKGAKLHQKRSP